MSKVKEMIYENRNLIEVLCNGKMCDFNFWIISYGTHPCCYVEIPKGHPLYSKGYDDIDNVECHGGLTYSRSYLLDKRNSWFIGWDYAHYDDYIGCLDKLDGLLSKNTHKWTTQELLKEVYEVCKQLKELEQNMGG